MQKIILSADIHNGLPGKLEDTIWSMDIIRQYANDYKIKNIIIPKIKSSCFPETNFPPNIPMQ